MAVGHEAVFQAPAPRVGQADEQVVACRAVDPRPADRHGVAVVERVIAAGGVVVRDHADGLDVYGVVVRVGNAVRSVRRSYDPIVTTLMSDIAVSRDMGRLKAAFSRATVLVMLTQTPIFAALACFADVLMPLFGVQFTDAVVPVLVICGFWLLNGAFGLNALIVNGFGRSDLIFVDLIFSTALQAGLLYLLVPNYGAVGASIAVGTGYLVTNLIQVAQGSQLSGINPYNRSTVHAAAAALPALIAGSLSLWLGHAYFDASTARIASVLVFIAVLLPMALPIVRGTRLPR